MSDDEYDAFSYAIRDSIRHGDVAALEENFSEESVRVEVDAIEAFIAANPDADSYGGDKWNRDQQPDPWYDDMKRWFEIAVKGGQVEVLEWFFAPARREFMRSTLPLLLANSMHYAIQHDKPDVLDFLLESPTCAALHSTDEKKALAQKLTRSLDDESSGDLLQVLLAHVMDVNSQELLEVACAETLPPSLVDTIVAEGACVVGNDLLSRCKDFNTNASLHRLLHHGAVVCSRTFYSQTPRYDYAGRMRELHHRVARVFIQDAFLDVDAPYASKRSYAFLTVQDVAARNPEILRNRSASVATPCKG